MKERVLIGAGGFAREVKAHMKCFDMKCFVDKQYYQPNNQNIFELSQFDPYKMEALIVISNPNERKALMKRLPNNTNFFSYIHPSAQLLSDDITIGKGTFISANCIITTNIQIGDHSQLNLNTTIGHDTKIGHFFTTAPGAKISGNCLIGDCVYVGTNASIKEKIHICNQATIGLQAGVIKNITEPGIYIGCPAKKHTPIPTITPS